MKEKTYMEAIKEAISEEMRKDGKVIMMGEDIAEYGGVFKLSKGMLDEFGPQRIINTPMSEAAITGCAIGMAITGMRPIVEIMFMDFTTLILDQIMNHASKFSYIYGGTVKVPLVVRTPAGAGRGYGASHSQSLESWFMHIPGMKIVMPSTPYDAKGLMRSCLKSNSPSLFIESKLLYTKKGDVPDDYYEIPIGKADIKKKGSDITIITYGRMVDISLELAHELEKEGISIEVLDLRSILPFDRDLIHKSVKNTGKVIIVEEDTKTAGVGAEISASICENDFELLKAPIRRVAFEDIPIPYCRNLEMSAIPSKERILEEILNLIDR
ncbi:alpha-ketoacid dehydrogenase subunit beta [Candidatus Aenigmatarchaeota archaeon]